jgi:hypothetical protein
MDVGCELWIMDCGLWVRFQVIKEVPFAVLSAHANPTPF